MEIKKDKIKHFFACLVVALMASFIEAVCGASYLLSIVTGIIAGCAVGIGKEYGDKCSPGNKWDWCDIGADLMGAIVGAALGSLFSLII